MDTKLDSVYKMQEQGNKLADFCTRYAFLQGAKRGGKRAEDVFQVYFCCTKKSGKSQKVQKSQ